MIFDWPPVLVPRDITVLPPRQTAGLTTSLSGFSQVSPVIRPPFGLTLDFDGLVGGQVLAWRALLASLEGRAGRVRVPLFDLCYAAADAAIGAGLTPHSDGATFSDAARYLTADLDGVVVTAEQGTRNIQADFGAYGPVLEAGQYFGLGDQPYVATQVHWTGSVATIRSSPTMRRDYEAQPLRLRPVMIGRLPDDDNGQLTLKRGRWATPSISFVEAFDEPLS
ncbi:hypothetical protein [Sphingomonas sp. VNH70]|uniref:hypothetical protein n=1 Tax=Sphingomonas silueang TaxID=3156617 RepID=UPI0032B536E2